MIQSEYNELGNQRISQLSESELTEFKNFQNVFFWQGLVVFILLILKCLNQN